MKRKASKVVIEEADTTKHSMFGYTPTIGMKMGNTRAAQYKGIAEMRSTGIAKDSVVDSMGCHQLHDENASEDLKRYHTLTALMLSSMTKDEQTHRAMNRLKTELEGGLSVDSILKVDSDILNEMISCVGFRNRKTLYLKKTAKILSEKYESKVPDTLPGLISLPGVGKKMAYLCLQHAFDKTEGIGVDIHVHRISNRLNWVHSKNPEGTRIQLEEWLPKPLWSEVNHMLVGFGQSLCSAKRPGCEDCTISDICPSSQKKKKKKTKEIE